MSWSNPDSPNLSDYTLFVANVMDIDPLYLPSTSPFLGYALDQAVALVIPPSRPWCAAPSGIGYTLATYNCAGHIQIRITPDQTDRDFFRCKRREFDMLKPSYGVVSSTGDDGTSVSLATSDALRQLTLGDLDFMKTPWGREYLAYAQDFGGLFGIS